MTDDPTRSTQDRSGAAPAWNTGPSGAASGSRWNTGSGGSSAGGRARFAGSAGGGLGGRVGDARDQLVGGFGRLVDAAEGQIHRAPAEVQPAARKAVDFARERPLATMAGLAALALMLTRGARRRF